MSLALSRSRDRCPTAQSRAKSRRRDANMLHGPELSRANVLGSGPAADVIAAQSLCQQVRNAHASVRRALAALRGRRRAGAGEPIRLRTRLGRAQGLLISARAGSDRLSPLAEVPPLGGSRVMSSTSMSASMCGSDTAAGWHQQSADGRVSPDAQHLRKPQRHECLFRQSRGIVLQIRPEYPVPQPVHLGTKRSGRSAGQSCRLVCRAGVIGADLGQCLARREPPQNFLGQLSCISVLPRSIREQMPAAQLVVLSATVAAFRH
jgi:hypothetical protein